MIARVGDPSPSAETGTSRSPISAFSQARAMPFEDVNRGRVGERVRELFSEDEPQGASRSARERPRGRVRARVAGLLRGAEDAASQPVGELIGTIEGVRDRRPRDAELFGEVGEGARCRLVRGGLDFHRWGRIILNRFRLNRFREGGERVSQRAATPAGRRIVCRWPIFGEEELAALRTVLESGEWSHASPEGYVGRYEPEFERAFADFHTAKHGLCVANGTVALQLALEALDIGVGDEVIVPGLTWQATAAAVLDVNAVPILVDVEPDTYCLDPAAVEAAITPSTKAVIAVHLYNSLADLDRLAAICAKHDLQLIEDCAHSHGSAWNGRGVGSLGAIGCFSFQSTKSLTCGEGGFCMTSNDELRDRLDSLRNCGRRPARATASWTPVQSGNYRLSEWEAAILAHAVRPLSGSARVAFSQRWQLDDAFGGIDGITSDAPSRAR